LTYNPLKNSSIFSQQISKKNFSASQKISLLKYKLKVLKSHHKKRKKTQEEATKKFFFSFLIAIISDDKEFFAPHNTHTNCRL
jgi:hypothetical protein